MSEEDIAKTAFRCPGVIGLFEWVVMTFGLKNAGATYYRAMNYIFHKLIGRIVEIYIDDVWGVRPQIPTIDHMGCAPRGGPAHKMKPCEARRCSASPTRHREDILKIL